VKIPDELLRPYGYAPGHHDSWCASCGRIYPGLAKRAFKCRPCASFDFRNSERDCLNHGPLPANPVPADLNAN
jgi:hypothetical protein